MEKLSEDTILQQLNKLDGWEYIDGALETTLEFKNFKEAFSAMTLIAFECEDLDHHPNWSNVYNRLTIRLSTHDADGITDKDFDLVKRIEKIIRGE